MIQDTSQVEEIPNFFDVENWVYPACFCEYLSKLRRECPYETIFQ